MIRVAVFIPRYFPIFGGAENQAKLLNRELIASKKVTIPFLLTHRLNKELEKKVVIDEIKVHRLGLPGMGLWSSLSFLLTSVLFLLIHYYMVSLIAPQFKSYSFTNCCFRIRKIRYSFL